MTPSLSLRFVLGILVVFGADARADLALAYHGRPVVTLVRQVGLTAPEEHALEELARTLEKIVGAEFAVRDVVVGVPERAVIVGPGPAAREAFPEVPWDALGPEEVVIRTRGGRLLLAGGRPRGTLYAVSRFLQQQCGVRWWTPWASHVPYKPTLRIGEVDERYAPVFESRDPFWYPAFDAQWAVRNFSNSQSARIPADLGGAIHYRGFVHTFFPLVPPDEHFQEHPEWYSLLKGKRTHRRAQLCLTNPDLRDFVVGRVRAWLQESPEARIVSVSQNDWHGACGCERCKALDDAEGSHAGTMLDFVNYVAAEIEDDFPEVAIDTLAYQYTRKPPKTIRPRPNVIVRLCSIECNFREPLEHPSNVKFADDIRGWAEICDRLYIWDYTTDFAHYVQPHPNWYVLGPNVRFFARHSVKGVFEQGAYQSYGSEFAELRAWVLAQLLWDPDRDETELIDEFLYGYYGPAAYPIGKYLRLLHEASAGWNLTCFSKTDTPFFDFATLRRAEQLWDEAERVVVDDPELLPRVRLARLPVRYVWLALWDKLRSQCRDAGLAWPLAESKQEVAQSWLDRTRGQGGLDWTKIRLVRESGKTPEEYIEEVLSGDR